MFLKYTCRFFILFYLPLTLFSVETFLLVDGKNGEAVMEFGDYVDVRVTPCSTFKIALALMGFDSGILHDEQSPVWEYQEGYDDYLECWKAPHTPLSWMQHSCIWYSRLLTPQLGHYTLQAYLNLLEYGNRDFSGGLTKAWLSSSLKISVREQVEFLTKLYYDQYPLSIESMHLTKNILYIETLPGGWKLYGKTGLSTALEQQIGWFVGWFENGEKVYPFAYQIRDSSIDTSKRIPRVIELFKILNF